MRALLVMPVLMFVGCSDSQPCRSCPPVDGVYAMQWQDGGGVLTGGCAIEGPRPPTLVLAQQDTNVTTTIEGAAIGGTFYDSYDLVLSGTGEGGASYRLRALAIPEGGGGDAGMSLRGSLTSRRLDDEGELCELTDSFTAQRTSR